MQVFVCAGGGRPTPPHCSGVSCVRKSTDLKLQAYNFPSLGLSFLVFDRELAALIFLWTFHVLLKFLLYKVGQAVLAKAESNLVVWEMH